MRCRIFEMQQAVCYDVGDKRQQGYEEAAEQIPRNRFDNVAERGKSNETI